ncbi:hypothetical protein G3I40_05515 [Streptomyces sp. SID14478]|uniref:hypothetical protein n=1 Tax=Streptomyces sp. SID14478 TaxID=2706073 RepID=UPI0013DA11D6|nr:hypothetical protein [Streptomyces sp. SID14478]NEB74690.1 hypothetical protein [Streptomyces sp. SID14478]
MRPKATRSVDIITALTAAILPTALSGCGSQNAADDPTADSDALTHRARLVASAWDGSHASAAWRAGYHPIGEVVQLPRGGWHSTADARAYESRSSVLIGTMPTRSPKTGSVKWANSPSLERPLTPAATAYSKLSGGRVGGRPHLTVTKTKLAEMTVSTSRGRATVPAWEFTLDGYDSPLKQAAVMASGLPRSPIHGTRELPGQPLRLAGVAEDGHSVTVTFLQGVCDKRSTPVVVETGGSVVLSYPITRRHETKLCTKQAKLEQVTVRLKRSVGDRVLLDAITGRPLAYKPSHGLSPSWT